MRRVVWVGAIFLLAAVALWIAPSGDDGPGWVETGRKGNGDRADDGDKSAAPQITLAFAPGSTAERVNARVVKIADPATLPKTGDGRAVLAAGTFEPTGATFPDGLEVTWGLGRKRAAGEKLAIVYRDGSAWKHEGGLATVGADGTKATGSVTHFSDIGLAELPDTTPDRDLEQSTDEGESPERAFARVVYKGTKPKVIKRARLQAVERVYTEWKKSAGNKPMDMKTMIDIYKAGDFDTVKTLIENEVIDQKHSYDLADLRTLMALEGVDDAVRRLKASEGADIRIYRSDTGNQTSGARSDMDQTLSVYKKEGDAWVRAPDLDGKALNIVENHVRRQGLTPAAFDMATIKGKDRFFDWRLVGVQADAHAPRAVRGKPYAMKIEYAIRALQGTPGAYWLCGPVHQQMVMRVQDAIEKHLKARPGSEVPADVRAMHPELAKRLPRANMQVCSMSGTDDSGKVVVSEVSLEQAKQVMFQGLDPKLMRGHAYDAVVNNMFDYMEPEKIAKTLDPKKEPAVKNVLRAVDDGLGTLKALDEGNGRRKTEYLAIKDKGARRAHLAKVMGPALANTRDANSGQKLLDRWFTVMEASRDLRKAHKDNGVVRQADLDKAFEPLAREIGGKVDETTMRLARQEYHTRCKELMFTSVVKTSTDRIISWVSWDPKDASKRAPIEAEIDEHLIRRALNIEGRAHDAAWKSMRLEIMSNYAELGRLQLLYSFRRMDPEVIKAIVEETRRRGIDPAKVERLAKQSKEFFFYARQLKDFLPLHLRILKGAAIRGVEYYRAKARDHLLMQLGFIDTDSGTRKRNPLIASIGLDGIDKGLHKYFRKNATNWRGIGSRYVRQTVFDVGNIDGVAQVARAWCESGGDPDVTAKAALREMVYALPIIGQAASLGATVYNNGLAAGAQQGFIMVACIAVPVAGIGALAFSLGEAGLVIYDHSYAKPLANAIEDAIYRGYVGPSLYDFSQDTPSRFGPAEQERLAKVQKLLDDNGRNTANEHLAKFFIEERDLLVWKSAWGAYLGEQKRSEGGTFFGYGKFDRQVALELEGDPDHPSPTLGMDGPLLARVKPMIFFPRGKDGVVDFTVKLTAAEEAELEALPKQVEQAKKSDPNGFYRLKDRLEVLEEKREMQARAARYLAAARRNHELMHQIRLDSLAPYIAADESHEMVATRRFVGFWIAIRRKQLRAEFEALGIPASVSAFKRAEEALGFRLTEDIDRSRKKWHQHKYFKHLRAKAREERLQKRMGRNTADMIMDVIEKGPQLVGQAVLNRLADFGNDLKGQLTMDAVNEAIGNRRVPSSDPWVEFAVRIIKGDPDAEKEEDRQDELRVGMKVTADPAYYGGQFTTSAFQLAPDAAKAAASSGTYKGLPLTDGQKKMLQEYVEDLGEIQPDQEKATPAILLFAWCTEHEIPDRVVPETIAKLPRLERYTVPDSNGEKAYLFGGGVSWVPKPPKTGPLEIRVHRETEKFESMTGIEVTSEALGKIEELPKGHVLRMRVEYATEEDGEFFALKQPRPWLPPTEPIRDELNNVSWQRIAKDKLLVLMSHEVESDMLRRKQRQKGPVWIRVVEYVQAPDGEEGEETISNVHEPGELSVRSLEERRWKDSDRIEQASQVISRLHVRMEPKDQLWRFPGAEFVVRHEGWTGHFVAGRYDADRKITFTSGEPRGARIWFPHRWDEVTIQVEATSGAYSASRTIRIESKNKPEPKYHEKRLARVKKAQKDALVFIDDREQRLIKSKAKYERELAQVENDPKYKNDPRGRARRVFHVKRSILSSSRGLRWIRQYDRPYTVGKHEYAVGRATHDYGMALRGARKMLVGARKRLELTRLQRTELAALEDEYYANAPHLKDHYEKILAGRRKAEEMRNYEDSQRNMSESARLTEVVSSAKLAGELQVLVDAREKRIALHKEMIEIRRVDGWKAEQLAGLENSLKQYERRSLKELAEFTHVFTGDRERAAQLWARGHDLHTEVDKYYKPLEKLTLFPAWWPEPADGSLYKPGG